MKEKIREVEVKSILNKHKKRDEWFLDDYSINPFFGCTFNCIYCYIRGSKYGKDMKKTFSLKINAPELLEKQLKRRANKGEYGIISLSSSTEAYLSIEKELKISRKLLKIILKYRFPVHVITKSPLVLRDLDILKEIDKNAILPEDLKGKLNRGVIISFSFSTLDENISKLFEPNAPKPLERMKTMKTCKENGFFVGANFIPILPYISDSKEKLDQMIKTAKEFGADFILAGVLTLFGKGESDCKTLYYKILELHFPDLIPKYRKLFRIFPTPSKDYQENLEKAVIEISQKYQIKFGIL